MTTITIVPAGPRDAAMHEGQFALLAAALDGAGFAVVTTTAEPPVEWRDFAQGVTGPLTDIVIHVGEDLAAGVLLHVVALVRKYLSGLRRPGNGEPRRYAVIYGPKGEVLSRLELPDGP